MAIQLRRGAYGDFDQTKLVPGEAAVVLEDDPNTADGKAFYVKFPDGAKHMATFEDMDDIADNLNSTFQEQVGGAVSSAQAFITSASTAETGRQTAETAREDAEDGRVAAELTREAREEQRQTDEASRQTAETARDTAESSRASAERARVVAENSRVTAENGRVQEEARRTAAFAEMELRSKGWLRHYCTEGEYNADTGVPTISNPNGATIYFVPKAGAPGENIWAEWILDDEDEDNPRWEPLGSVESNIDPVTAAQIDDIVAGTTKTGSEVTTLTGLSYFFTSIKTAFMNLFAPKSHTHNASDITAGQLAAALIANGTITAEMLADNAVTEGKIFNGAITQSKIADDAVSADKIADGAVVTSAIADNAVTFDKLSQELRDSQSRVSIDGTIDNNGHKLLSIITVDADGRIYRLALRENIGEYMYRENASSGWQTLRKIY